MAYERLRFIDKINKFKRQEGHFHVSMRLKCICELRYCYWLWTYDRLILFVSRTEKTEATVVTLQHCQGQVADGKNWLKDDGSMENSNRDSQR
ncbi:unnamed protein product [Plutella xylostella]|uniref:(diamondback moth) hypothetical protein n=1 Tax=Plutella xylostella TaxID=51655 RepID=A0A8S4DQD8_PLUXY|nr:unnamed protein product [Plutella xylostella]